MYQQRNDGLFIANLIHKLPEMGTEKIKNRIA